MSDSSSEDPLALERPTWVGGPTPVARLVARPIIRFIDLEVAGGIVLLGATGVALMWAASPASDSCG